jgi:nitroreductase
MKPQPRIEHPVHDLIRKRWSPRAFSDQPIARESVLALFEAARWAASANNEQPWRFIYAAKGEDERYSKLFDCLGEYNQVWAASAPVLILTLVKTHFSGSDRPNKWALHDLGLALGNLTIQAAALDLYGHNMGGFSAEKAKQHFNLPDGIEPVTMIAVGYLGDPEQLPEPLKERELAQQQRKSIEELLFD